MSQAIATIEAAGVAVDHHAILKSLNLNPRDPNTQALLLVCERYGLDPLLKHMVLISGNPYITRDGYLAIAHRSGVFDGMEVLEQGADQTHYTAKVAVYRKDMGRPFTFIGRYPKGQRMAKDYGPEMAVKVAEVQALRRAFNVTGVPAADERWDEEAHTSRVEAEAPQRTRSKPAVVMTVNKPDDMTDSELGAKVAEALDKHMPPNPRVESQPQHVSRTRPPADAVVVDTGELPPSTGTRKRKPPTGAGGVGVAAPSRPRPELADAKTVADVVELIQGLKEAGGEWPQRGRDAWHAAGVPSRGAESLTQAEAEAAFAALSPVYVEAVKAAPAATSGGDAA